MKLSKVDIIVTYASFGASSGCLLHVLWGTLIGLVLGVIVAITSKEFKQSSWR
jgi:ABC-type phosphate transport system permease subunit